MRQNKRCNKRRNFARSVFASLATVATLATLTACRSNSAGGAASSTASASTTSPNVVMACVAVAADSVRPRVPDIAALLIALRHEPASTPASEASVRIESETSRSTVKIDPASPARFELSPGLYDVRVSQEGYNNVTARVTLAAGCTATFSPTLQGRTGRK